MSTTTADSSSRLASANHATAGRRAGVLGVAWLHGSVHVSSFRRQQLIASWSAPSGVHTLEDFAAALETAMAETGYRGTDAFIVLENEAFLHQLETVPSFSDRAARAYLRGRIERIEKEQEPMLWVSQRAMTVRKEHAFLLHLLPGGFYYKLNEIFLARRLELSRVLPMIVPLQLELASLAHDVKTPVLLAAEAGKSTAVMAGIPGGDVLFSRTTLASWSDDAPRVAVEINRSLLYAKQQFGATVDRAWLLGAHAESAKPEVEARCGAGKEIIAQTRLPENWLRHIAGLAASHPVNLVSGHLRRRRRNRWMRSLVMAACWTALALTGFDTWRALQSWRAESAALQSLQDGEDELHLELARLEERNAAAEIDRATIDRIVNDRLPPVPGRFLATLAESFPREARIIDFNVKLGDAGRWSVRIDGEIQADEETTRMVSNALQRQLERGPFRVRFMENARPIAATTIQAGGVKQRFSLEGDLFEN